MLEPMRHRGIVTMLAGLVAGTVIGGATLVSALSQEEAAPTTVRVCVGKRNAVVAATRSGKCPAGSRLTKINRVGPAGPVGPPGPAGTGLPGSDGSPGPTGPSGSTSTVEPYVIDGGKP